MTNRYTAPTLRRTNLVALAFAVAFAATACGSQSQSTANSGLPSVLTITTEPQEADEIGEPEVADRVLRGRGDHP